MSRSGDCGMCAGRDASERRPTSENATTAGWNERRVCPARLRAALGPASLDDGRSVGEDLRTGFVRAGSSPRDNVDQSIVVARFCSSSSFWSFSVSNDRCLRARYRKPRPRPWFSTCRGVLSGRELDARDDVRLVVLGTRAAILDRWASRLRLPVSCCWSLCPAASISTRRLVPVSLGVLFARPKVIVSAHADADRPANGLHCVSPEGIGRGGDHLRHCAERRNETKNAGQIAGPGRTRGTKRRVLSRNKQL
jgi:hypothetical protein